MKSKPTISSNFIMLIGFIILFLSFNSNIFNAYKDDLHTFGYHSERIVIGDMIYNQLYGKDTLFYQWLDMSGDPPCEVFNDAYINKSYVEKPDILSPYWSQIGFGSLIYNGLRIITPFLDNEQYLHFLHTLTAFMTTICIFIFTRFIGKYVSPLSSILTFFMIIFLSPLMIRYGVNLYWVSWTWFLPMAASMLFIDSRLMESRQKYVISFLIAFSSCLLKLLYSYEFVSTVFIALICPYVFICIYKKFNIKKMFFSLLFPSLGALIAFAVSVIIKLFNTYQIVGSWSKAKEIFSIALVHTTHMPVATIFNTIHAYLKWEAFSILGISITFNMLCVCFVFFILVGVLLCLKGNLPENRKQIIYGLIISTLIAFFAPISWFTLATHHSNPEVHGIWIVSLWYVPFMLFAYAMSFYILENVIMKCFNIKTHFEFFYNNTNNITKSFIHTKLLLNKKRFIIFSFLLMVCAIFMLNIIFANKRTLEFIPIKSILISEIPYENDYIKIFYNNNTIYFLTNNNEISNNRFCIKESNTNVSLDFVFKDKKINTSALSKFDIAAVNFTIANSSISVEMYNHDNNTIFKNDISIDTVPLYLYNITDSNWTNGIYNFDSSIILLDGNSPNYTNLVGKSIQLNDKSIRKIINIEYSDPNYTRVFLDEMIDPSNGSPNIITIISD